jgi:hypothetical protein
LLGSAQPGGRTNHRVLADPSGTGVWLIAGYNPNYGAWIPYYNE